LGLFGKKKKNEEYLKEAMRLAEEIKAPAYGRVGDTIPKLNSTEVTMYTLDDFVGKDQGTLAEMSNKLIAQKENLTVRQYKELLALFPFMNEVFDNNPDKKIFTASDLQRFRAEYKG